MDQYVSTIVNRQYAVLKETFKPTDVGRVVNKFLTTYFEHYVDYEFTAQLEDALDAVSRGKVITNRYSMIFGNRSQNYWSN